jgi:hypothetical protein
MIRKRAQRSYDHRLVRLVQETGDITIATKLGVPRSTAAGWLRRAQKPVTTIPELDSSAVHLRARVLRLERRLRLLLAVIRVLFAVLRSVHVNFASLRIAADDKARLLRAIERFRGIMRLRRVLRRALARAASRLAKGGAGLRAAGPAIVSRLLAASTDRRGDRRYPRDGDFTRVPARPHGKVGDPRSAALSRLRVRRDLAPPRPGEGMAPSATAGPPESTQDRDSSHEAKPDLARRYHGRASPRRGPGRTFTP